MSLPLDLPHWDVFLDLHCMLKGLQRDTPNER
jgi:hypothetical protein